ncbi:MAG: hypothetical protein FWD31_08645 [Planctomycetaceae bacterium]|nr:hypothetical protein [Planctomycetaceae bacterium]
MLYLIFFVSNYFTLGVGVWVAIQHGELLRHPTKHNENDIDQADDSFVSLNISPDDAQNNVDFHDAVNDSLSSEPQERQIVDNETQPFENQPDDPNAEQSGNRDTAFDVPDASDQESSERLDMSHQPRFETHHDEERLVTNERLRWDSGILSVAKPLIAGEMMEQLVGMVKHDASDNLTSVIRQLQEIHDMATAADNHYYASEDAEFFVTPDKQQFATMTFCRPMVGLKRDKVSGMTRTP